MSPFLNMICPDQVKWVRKQSETARYMELPDKNGELEYVMQHHFRGKSVHVDWRMALNDHLIGWTVMEGVEIEEDVTNQEEAQKILDNEDLCFQPDLGMGGRKCRCTTKARQPKGWMEVEGKVEEDEVGSTEHGPGYFNIIDEGTVTFGCQKPPFHEYFLDGDRFDKLRVIVRGLKLPELDPKTKRPIEGQYNLVWNTWVPEDQDPYAVSERARRKKWYPPKDFIPIPDWWIEENEEKFKEWKKRAEEHWKNSKMLKKALANYTLHEHSWMRRGVEGKPVGSRGIPQKEWFLHVQMNSKPRTWQLNASPLYARPLVAIYDGKNDKKWMDYEGKLEPKEAWNPNKELKSSLDILAQGTMNIESKRKNGAEVIALKFQSGKLEGTWFLRQEDEGSEMYTLSKGEIAKMQTSFKLTEENGKFTVSVDKDIFVDTFTLEEDPVKVPQEIEVKREKQDSTPDGEVMDGGDVDIIENTKMFIAMRFFGDKLEGLYHLIKRDGKWYFGPSELPPVSKAFKIKESPSKIEVTFRDIRYFTMCLPDDETHKYDVPAPPKGAKLRICLKPRPNTVHLAKIQAIVFPKPDFDAGDVKDRDFSKYEDWEADRIKG